MNGEPMNGGRTNSVEDSRRLTVRDVLLDNSSGADDSTEVVARSFRERGVVRSGIKGFRHLSGPAMQAVTMELVEVILKSLDLLDLKDLLVGGWCKCKDLTEAAARTRAVAGSEELVALASHRIVSDHHPSVDLFVKETKVHTSVFDVSVEFDLTGVLAVVRQGRLAALRGGTCVITATLALGEIPLLPPQQRRIDLTKFVTLNPGVPLLADNADRKSHDEVA